MSFFEKLIGSRNSRENNHGRVPGQTQHFGTLDSARTHLETSDCMSENYASTPQISSPSTSGHGPASTPVSVSQVGTTSTSQSSSRRGSQHPWSFSAISMNSRSIDFGQLQIRSQDYDDSPASAKQWLRSFGDLRPGTNVSANLTAKKAIDTDGDGGITDSYPSMLPILAKWLRMWFDRASSARHQKRKNQTDKSQKIVVPEDDDFEWMCAYITDYLTLVHEGLSEEDIVALIESALHICTKSGALVDFDRILKLLKCVYSKYGCPTSVFKNFLYILCGIRGGLRELPTQLNECLDLILSGPESHAAIEVLHDLLQTDFSKLDHSKVSISNNAARGAIQVFQEIVENKTPLAVSVEDLLTSLSSALSMQSARVNEVVLPLCASLLEHEPSTVNGSDGLFQKIMEVINIAYLAVKLPIQTAEESPSGSVHSAKDGRSREPIVHANIRDHIDSVLGKLLRSLTGFKQSLVFKHFMTCAQQQSAETSMDILQFAGEELLNWQVHDNWRDYGLQIVRTFVQDSDVTSELRLAAIGIIEGAFWSPGLSWTHDHHVAVNDSEEVTTLNLAQEMFHMIRTESNPIILKALVDIAVRAVLTYDSRDSMMQICNDLEDVVFREKSSSQVTKTSEIGARGLVSIFMQSLNTEHTDRTELVYQKLDHIASSFQAPAEARLAAMRLLFRLRCDSIGRIYVSQSSDSEYLAAALCRTDETAAKFPRPAEGPDDRVTSRSSGLTSRRAKPTPPLWIYPGVPALPHVPEIKPSEYVFAPGHENTKSSRQPGSVELELGIWLESVIACLQKDPDWETYSYIIVHIGAQLSNVRLLEGTVHHIKFLRSVLCEQVRTTRFHEPPVATGLKRGDVALCIFNALTPIIAYKAHFGRNECDELVKAFAQGIGSFEGTSRGCIHSLALCCFEIPASVSKNLSTILHKIQTNATQSHLSMHFLEFFAGLARQPGVHTNLRGDDIRLIFGICIGYIKSMRDRRAQSSEAGAARKDTSTARLSGGIIPPFRAKIISAIELPQYVSALAYHTMIFWFLSLKLSERAKHVPWIIKSLIFVDNEGNEQIEEQSEVFIDMMQRTAFSDLGETIPRPNFAKESDGPVSAASWLIGLSIVTIETAGTTGLSQITKRQASGTTHSVYQQFTADLPLHHAPLTTEIRPETSLPTEMLPHHVLLQMLTSCAPTALPSQPLPLPDAEYVNRALRAFDLNPTVDSHKIGVIYVGPGQTEESAILANTGGSADFDNFLDGLGTKVKLEDAKFNTQGLRSDTDGEYTYAWRDRVTEVVYHVPSMMPTNLEDDPKCTNKKMHIGNDYVNIIFNRSGEAFDFHTFNSQFNYVNIVVTPASRTCDDEAASPSEGSTTEQPPFYKVQTLAADGFPAISPASDSKVISASNLAGFVRIVALNASVFSLAWRDRDSPNADYVSSWRNRLQEIRRLRDRVTREAAAAASEPRKGGALYAGYGKGHARTSLYPEGRGELTGERKAPVVDYENVEVRGEEKMAELYDFSRWSVQ